MTLVVIAGAPGAGKTTLLAELAQLGHATVSDSAREVIRERKARGFEPRPEPLDFANEILRRDALKYRAAQRLAGWVFFERSGLEALAMIEAAGPTASSEAAAQDEFSFHRCVFVLPPWQAIYVNDAERDQSFEHALRVHRGVTALYAAHGYQVCGVPCAPPGQRARYVLEALATPQPYGTISADNHKVRLP